MQGDVYRITIGNWRPARINELMRAGHWSGVHKQKKYERQTVGVYALLSKVPRATGKRRVSLEITLKGRQQEVDPGAYDKSLMDALVHATMLVDDSSEWCEVGGYTYNRDGAAKTVIVLEDL